MQRKLFFFSGVLTMILSCQQPGSFPVGRMFNTIYEGEYLNRVAFPIGGIGAGMVCLEGTGAISHVSVRNKPDVLEIRDRVTEHAGRLMVFPVLIKPHLKHGSRLVP